MNRGFTLVEILLSVALLAILIPAFAQVLSLATFTALQGKNFSQAYALGQEQMEAVLGIKNQGGTSWDWVSTPANTGTGQYYQPVKAGDTWQLGPATAAPDLSAVYTKLVEIKPVKRCGKAICTEAWGVVDDFSREIRVTILWRERGQEQTITTAMLVTNI